ncbi:MAG: outer membrane protein assembly factor [Bacteroidales bacterium]|nr:outer membrane protein assembly factor [Bacteroidales bacterium]
MRKNIIIGISFILFLPGLFISELTAQENKSDFFVYTIGNLADLNSNSPELIALLNLIKSENAPSAIIFSGDITKADLTDKSQRTKDSIRLVFIIKQFQLAKITDLVFIPGDRDWAYSGKNGLENVEILENILEDLPFENIRWKPGHGCPGPKEIEIGENVILVIINTQYWNHPFDIPGPTDAECKISSQHDFLEELEDIVSETKNKNILITGHFPIISTGEYGGRMSLKKHLFPLTDVKPGLWIPLPIVGSIYPSFRQNVGSQMDIINENYELFNTEIKNIIQDHPGLIYLSGHDYIQQLIYSEDSYFINSGSLSQNAFTGNLDDEIYAAGKPGIFRIEYFNNGNVNGTALVFSENLLKSDQTFHLYRSACLTPDNSIPVNEFYAPCKLETIFPEKMSETYDEPVSTIAGEEYEAGGFKELFLGKHYRDTWTAPVQINYLNLDTTFGGLTPIKRGGGRQTTSLKFRAGNGCEYVFRSVNKNPKKALSYELRESVVADLVKDQTTTQQPYGAMATKLMLKKLDILHPEPVLYLLPPDDKLGPFKQDYSNLLGMLEESPKSPSKTCDGFGGSDEVLRSYKLFRNLYKSHKYKVDQKEFAKAKVFDIFIGDWGRHEDNWKWAGYKSENGTIYKPIPRDRDHVFSVWDGLLPWIADREWAKTSGDHFVDKVYDIRSLTWSARHLDRVALTEMTREDWLRQTKIVKETLTDEIIETSIRNMPPEIYDISGNEIENKLKTRKENLDEYILDYYKLLAKYVDVLGSGKKEIFNVTRQDDRSVKVIVTNKNGDKELYKRTFFPKETKEIRLFGLGNEDEFNISGESDKSILIRVIGGEGFDIIKDSSKVNGFWKRTLIYEKDPDSKILTGNEAKQINSWNDKIYEYDRHSFKYNTYFPLPYLGYNSDDGFKLGMGVSFTRQKYGKEDYSTKYSFNIKGSAAGNLQFYYDVRFHHVIRKWDFKYYGFIAQPTDYVNFYGYGNETIKTDSLYNANFYKTQYSTMQAGVGVIRDFWKRSVFSLWIRYENNESQISDNTILDLQNDILGTEKVNLLEGVAQLDLDFRNDKKFPEKGMRLYGEFKQGLITSNNNSTYNKLLGYLEFHSTIHTKLPIFIGLRGGGAISSGEIPFYSLNNLGQNNFLRGYRKNRFAGESMLFFNTDVKLQILDIATAVVPVKFGIRGFYDIGRVNIENEDSNRLHAGYGGGIYLIPVERIYSLGLNIAFSEEESGLIIFELGISF